jgi:hypothetical protein
MNKEEMGDACNTRARNEKCIEDFSPKILNVNTSRETSAWAVG